MSHPSLKALADGLLVKLAAPVTIKAGQRLTIMLT
jgi:hypothetical protein